jgi:membrane associated rhomboid family serine protease
MGLLGVCEIMTESQCSFHRGTFHSTNNACDEVDCLQDVCKLSEFVEHGKPDQGYRIILALFMDVGVIHLLLVQYAQLHLGWNIETVAGWWRTAIIYLSSGIFGNILSGVASPFCVATGPTGALFGFLGCIFVEVWETWEILKSPVQEMMRLLFITICCFVLGTLPFVPNWAHLGGLVMGLCCGVVLMPYVSFSKRDDFEKKVAHVVCFAVIIACYIFGLSMLLCNDCEGVWDSCSGCDNFNCQDYVAGSCKDMQQHEPDWAEETSRFAWKLT